jgi:uroporphyrinogen-III synthase
MSRRRVLNTRAPDQASELSRLLAEAGFESVESPAITAAYSWEAGELDGVRRDLRAGLFDWVVLPSQNAGRGLEPELNAARVLCGAATASALGISAEVTLERFSAARALEVLRRGLVQSGQHALVPRAAEGREELLDGLRELGVIVSAPVAYRTVAVESAASRLRAGGIDVVTVCSPSAMRSVAPAITPDHFLVCLGETTAEAAREMGLRVDAVAARTSMDALVEAVAQLPTQVVA